jgi:hypothetical protein
MTRATLLAADRPSREVRGFAREVKFVVTPATAARISDWARQHLEADPYGSGPYGDQYVTTSLYFDTRERDVLHGRGSYKRAKFRIRRYGSSDQVYLERKLRSKVLLAKRRTPIAFGDLPLVADADYPWAGRWFQQRLETRRLEVACQVSYRRTARVGASSTGQIRLTLDEQLRATRVNTIDFTAAEGIHVFEPFVIVEMKYRAVVPAMFKRLIEDVGLMPEPISKYRLAMSALEGRPASRPKPARVLELAYA